MSENVMNPENIEVGDTVRLHNHHNDTYSKPMKVIWVGGSYGNKVETKEGTYYATCYKLVKKA